jgi:hypothetical protein
MHSAIQFLRAKWSAREIDELTRPVADDFGTVELRARGLELSARALE